MCYPDLILKALKIACDASKEIMLVYDEEFDVVSKKDGSPLTIADTKSHNIISKTLSETNIPVISEESKLLDYDIRKDSELLWLVDPLDGTKEFVKRNGEFTVNISLIKNKVPVIGIISVPVQRKIYFGWVGKGAYEIDITDEFYDSLKIMDFEGIKKRYFKQLNSPDSLKNNEISLVVSRSHFDDNTNKLVELLEKENYQVRVLKIGSALKFGIMAEGSANIYLRSTYSYEWDIAAGDAIINAIGGKLLSLSSGQPLMYNKPDLKNPGFIATTSDSLLKIVREKFLL